MVLEALLLALLIRVFPQLRRIHLAAPHPAIGAAAQVNPVEIDLAPALRPFWRYDIHGCAPHAAVVALGLVPDWILVGSPGRGMRALAPQPRPRPHIQPARAPPPTSRTPAPENTLRPESADPRAISYRYNN